MHDSGLPSPSSSSLEAELIIDPGTGGVLPCVLETETTVRNQTLKQETESDKQETENKSDPEGTIKERNNPRKNNFSTNPGNFPEHYIFLTQIR